MTRRATHARLALAYINQTARGFHAEFLARLVLPPRALCQPLFLRLLAYRERCARRAVHHARAALR